MCALCQRGLALFSEFRATPRAFATALLYVLFFLKELVKSNINVARIVLAPSLPLTPGIVKVKTRLKSSMGRMLLRMIVADAEPDAPRLDEPLARVLGPAALTAIVLVLGLWLPAPLKDVLAQAAHSLGGFAP